jgi:hypothetical protein
LVLGLWFVAVTAAPEVAHACPMHGSHVQAARGDATHSGHDARAAQAEATAHHRAPGTDSPAQHSNQCSCLGHCCSTSPVAFVPTGIALADIVTISTRDAGLPDYAYVPVAARHVQPLAHAPPLGA